MKKYTKLITLSLVVLVPVWFYLLFYTPQPATTEAPEAEESVTEEGVGAETQPSEDVVETVEEEGVEALGRYTVNSVIDGDTFMVSDGTELLTVRVLGIDAPETAHSPDGAECYNEESTAAARKLLSGSVVTLYRDYSQDLFDTYGRVIAYVDLADGTDFGEWMLENGYAKEYTFKGVAYERQSLYKESETSAKEAEAGLWTCGN